MWSVRTSSGTWSSGTKEVSEILSNASRVQDDPEDAPQAPPDNHHSLVSYELTSKAMRKGGTWTLWARIWAGLEKGRERDMRLKAFTLGVPRLVETSCAAWWPLRF